MFCPYCQKPIKEIESTETVATYECTNKKCETKDSPIHFLKRTVTPNQ